MNVCMEELSAGPSPRYLKLCSLSKFNEGLLCSAEQSERSNENQRYYCTELHHCATTGIPAVEQQCSVNKGGCFALLGWLAHMGMDTGRPGTPACLAGLFLHGIFEPVCSFKEYKTQTCSHKLSVTVVSVCVSSRRCPAFSSCRQRQGCARSLSACSVGAAPEQGGC